jgi:hypothetical protein
MTAARPRAQAPPRIVLLALVLVATSGAAEAPDADTLPERVTFPSADGRTTLVGYVYTPRDTGGTRVPAVVMMHGRSGAYSSLANGRYDASTLSRRHQMWGRDWAAQGYVALMVDGFGPRGHPQGFARGTYRNRPGAPNEVTVRPLDAYGALAYLPHPARCHSRAHRAAGLVERRQRRARGHGARCARDRDAHAGGRLPRGAGVLSGLRPAGPVRARA